VWVLSENRVLHKPSNSALNWHVFCGIPYFQTGRLAQEIMARDDWFIPDLNWSSPVEAMAIFMGDGR